MSMVEQYKKQHLETYKNASIEIIKNNTKSLVENDILPLVKKPPLDSMDIIKSKLISLAKKEKIVLDTKGLEELIESYRIYLLGLFNHLIDIRVQHLVKKVEDFEPKRENEVIKIQKKDLEVVNKKIKAQVKEDTLEAINKKLLSNLSSIYTKTDNDKQDEINKLFEKFMRTTYLKQLNESIAIKILVKDRTLLSGIAEQGERYLFTKNNSHIFNDNMENAL